MKKHSILFVALLSLIGLLWLAACAQTETAIVEDRPLNEETISNESSPPNDLSLVANTGRPQFLNVFANW